MPTTSTASPGLSLTVACLVLVLTGCASSGGYFPAQQIRQAQNDYPQAQSCRRLLHDIQSLVIANDRQDAGEQPVTHFPYLRSNRFLAAVARADLNTQQTGQLLRLLRQTGTSAMQGEVRNLPGPARQQLQQSLQGSFAGKDINQVIDLCGRLLVDSELRSSTVLNYVKSQLFVDDNYNTWQRIVGLYYITLFPVLWGINDWHDDAMAVFNTPAAELPVRGTLQRHTLQVEEPALTRQQAQQLLERASANPLQIPLPDREQRRRLIESFAPVWEIDTASPADRIGVPYWPAPAAASPYIDTGHPVMYTKLSHDFFQGEVLLQINYMIWFPERPCRSALDILCGHIDGLIWRVTLSSNGLPVMFDSIHSCGCYHQFFPSPGLRQKQKDTWLQEPILVPYTLSNVGESQRVVVRLASGSHFINAVSVEPHALASELATVPVTRQRYDTLRSLPVNGGQSRSMFDTHGLVPGTQRAERFLLWPMGVPSPGAMRQWGTHATAFVGRRHFDDPCLMENLFTANGAIRTVSDLSAAKADSLLYRGICAAKNSTAHEQGVTPRGSPGTGEPAMGH